MAVSSIMSRQVTTVTAEDSLASLRQIFTESHFQHVPVVDAMKRVVGIVSVKDFYQALSPIEDSASSHATEVFLTARKVRHVMTSPVICVRPETAVMQAASLLVQHNISCLVVTSSQQTLLGIVSWKDIMRLIVHKLHRKAERGREEEE